MLLMKLIHKNVLILAYFLVPSVLPPPLAKNKFIVHNRTKEFILKLLLLLLLLELL